MKHALAVLTAVNLLLLVFLLSRVSPAAARQADAVLRGSALEIVDDAGRIRASIRIHPAGLTLGGEPYPDTAILRLVDPHGRPEVKLEASERGGGLGLVGASDTTHVLLSAKGAEASLTMTNGDGRRQRVAP